MTTDTRTAMQRFVEFINTGDASIGRQVISPDAEFRTPFSPEPLRGLEGYLQILAIMRSAFSDVQWRIERLVVEGDSVAARFELRGTHDGDFLGTAPTGLPVAVHASNFYRFADGLIVDEVGQPDLMGLLGQIGALPLSVV
ncbi:ester cyclase [Curtobacterium flaccumfaciens pv. oortii]|uniref:ester cyclase n=1 Tax=Curtobacterium flaccumfaciens TaxID=2035 RepID=UPI001BDEF75E|nr:ester cyclase [Curtobacterium flaccumfaciens]MBT1621352.1 ester cyclase [Curtobacterium flaccumfaciens pv. oortii]